MARPDDIEALPVMELRKLRRRDDAALVARARIERDELRAKLEAMAGHSRLV